MPQQVNDQQLTVSAPKTISPYTVEPVARRVSEQPQQPRTVLEERTIMPSPNEMFYVMDPGIDWGSIAEKGVEMAANLYKAGVKKEQDLKKDNLNRIGQEYSNRLQRLDINIKEANEGIVPFGYESLEQFYEVAPTLGPAWEQEYNSQVEKLVGKTGIFNEAYDLESDRSFERSLILAARDVRLGLQESQFGMDRALFRSNRMNQVRGMSGQLADAEFIRNKKLAAAQESLDRLDRGEIPEEYSGESVEKIRSFILGRIDRANQEYDETASLILGDIDLNAPLLESPIETRGLIEEARERLLSGRRIVGDLEGAFSRSDLQRNVGKLRFGLGDTFNEYVRGGLTRVEELQERIQNGTLRETTEFREFATEVEAVAAANTYIQNALATILDDYMAQAESQFEEVFGFKGVFDSDLDFDNIPPHLIEVVQEQREVVQTIRDKGLSLNLVRDQSEEQARRIKLTNQTNDAYQDYLTRVKDIDERASLAVSSGSPPSTYTGTLDEYITELSTELSQVNEEHRIYMEELLNVPGMYDPDFDPSDLTTFTSQQVQEARDFSLRQKNTISVNSQELQRQQAMREQRQREAESYSRGTMRPEQAAQYAQENYDDMYSRFRTGDPAIVDSLLETDTFPPDIRESILSQRDADGNYPEAVFASPVVRSALASTFAPNIYYNLPSFLEEDIKSWMGGALNAHAGVGGVITTVIGGISDSQIEAMGLNGTEAVKMATARMMIRNGAQPAQIQTRLAALDTTYITALNTLMSSYGQSASGGIGAQRGSQEVREYAKFFVSEDNPAFRFPESTGKQLFEDPNIRSMVIQAEAMRAINDNMSVEDAMVAVMTEASHAGMIAVPDSTGRLRTMFVPQEVLTDIRRVEANIARKSEGDAPVYYLSRKPRNNAVVIENNGEELGAEVLTPEMWRDLPPPEQRRIALTEMGREILREVPSFENQDDYDAWLSDTEAAVSDQLSRGNINPGVLPAIMEAVMPEGYGYDPLMGSTAAEGNRFLVASVISHPAILRRAEMYGHIPSHLWDSSLVRKVETFEGELTENEVEQYGAMIRHLMDSEVFGDSDMWGMEINGDMSPVERTALNRELPMRVTVLPMLPNKRRQGTLLEVEYFNALANDIYLSPRFFRR